MKFIRKLRVIIQNCLLKFHDLLLSSLWKLVILSYHWQIVKSMHVMIYTTLDSFLISLQRSLHCFPIHNKVEGNNEDDDEDSWETVAPDVDTLIVKHKQASEYFSGSVKVDSISVCNVVVIFHVSWSSLVVTNVVLLIVVFHLLLRLGLICLLCWISHWRNQKINILIFLIRCY